MGALRNWQHEKFAKELSRRLCAGEDRGKGGLGRVRTAAYVEVYGESEYAATNARRQANRKDVSARVLELNQRAADLAEVDAAWCVLELKRRVANFNLDDYLAPPAADGTRYFDISRASREQLGRLAELSMEDETVLGGEGEPDRRIRKTRLKPYDAAGVIGLIARIQGCLAPEKVAATNTTGDGPAEIVHRFRWLDPEPDPPDSQAA